MFIKYFKRLLSIVLMISLFSQNMAYAVLGLYECDEERSTIIVRGTLTDDQTRDLALKVASESIRNLVIENQGKVALSVETLSRITSLNNHRGGNLLVYGGETEDLKVEGSIHNNGYMEFHLNKHLIASFMGEFRNDGIINCLDARGEIKEALKFQLVTTDFLQRGCLVGNVALGVSFGERSLQHELGGMIGGRGINLENIHTVSATLFSAYNQNINFGSEDGDIMYSYSPEAVVPKPDVNPFAPRITGNLFGKNIFDWKITSASEERIQFNVSSLMRVGGVKGRIESGGGGSFLKNRVAQSVNQYVGNESLDGEDFRGLVSMIPHLELDQLVNLSPLFRGHMEMDSLIGHLGMDLDLGEGGDFTLQEDLSVLGEGRIKGKIFSVGEETTFTYKDNLSLETKQNVVDGKLKAESPTNASLLTSTGDFQVTPSGEITLERYKSMATNRDIKFLNQGTTQIQSFDAYGRYKTIFKGNEGLLKVEMEREDPLYLEDNVGKVITNGGIESNYTAGFLSSLRQDEFIPGGINSEGKVKILVNSDLGNVRVKWNQDIETRGPIEISLPHIHLEPTVYLESGEKITLKGDYGVKVDGILQAPHLEIKGEAGKVEGTGILDAETIILRGQRINVNNFSWGEDLENLHLRPTQVLKFKGGNEFLETREEKAFNLPGVITIKGSGDFNIRSSLRAAKGVLIAQDEAKKGTVNFSENVRVSAHKKKIRIRGHNIEFRGRNKLSARDIKVEGLGILEEDQGLVFPDSTSIKASRFKTIHPRGVDLGGNYDVQDLFLAQAQDGDIRTRWGSFKKPQRAYLIAPEERLTQVTPADFKTLGVVTQTFLPSDLRAEEADINAEIALLEGASLEGHFSIRGDVVQSRHSEATGSMDVRASGSIRIETSGMGDLSTTAPSTYVADSHVKKWQDLSSQVTTKNTRATSVTLLPIEREKITFLGDFITEQLSLTAKAKDVLVDAFIRHASGERLESMHFEGERGEVFNKLNAQRLTLIFDSLKLKRADLETDILYLKAKTLDLIETTIKPQLAVLNVEEIQTRNSHVEGGRVVLTSASLEGASTEEEVIYRSRAQETLPGYYDLRGLSTKVQNLYVAAGAAEFNILNTQAKRAEISLNTFGDGGLRGAMRLGHMMEGLEHVHIDAHRLKEDLFINWNETWRKNFHLTLGGSVHMNPHSHLHLSGESGIHALGSIHADRARLSAEGSATLVGDQGGSVRRGTTMEATENLSFYGGANTALESTKERTGDSSNYQERMEEVSLKAGRALHIGAGLDLLFVGAKTESGTGTTFRAGGTIRDIPLALESQRMSYWENGWSRDKWVRNQVSTHTSGGVITADAEGSQELYAPKFEASRIYLRGANGVKILDVHDTHEHESHSTKKGGFFGGNKTVHVNSYRADSVGAHVTARENVEIVADKDAIILVNTSLYTPKTTLKALEGIVKILLGKNYYSYSQVTQSRNAFWQSMSATQVGSETHVAPTISGEMQIYSKETILQQVRGKALEYAGRIQQNGGDITYDFVQDFYESQTQSASGPTAALAALVAIAVTMLTAGAGSGLGVSLATAAGQTVAVSGAAATVTVGTTAIGLTTAGAVIHGMGAAMLTSVCTQGGLCLLSSGGDLSKAAKNFTSSDSLKGMLISTAMGGVKGYFGTQTPFLGAKNEFLGCLETGIKTNVVGAFLWTAISGEDLGRGLKQGLINAGIDALAQTAAAKIGKKRHPTDEEGRGSGSAPREVPISDAAAYALHFISQGGIRALGAALLQEEDVMGQALSAGIGAAISEISMDLLVGEVEIYNELMAEDPDMDRRVMRLRAQDILESKRKLGQFIGAATGGIAGGHVNAANEAAQVATEHNFVPMLMAAFTLIDIGLDLYSVYRDGGEEAVLDYIKTQGLMMVGKAIVKKVGFGAGALVVEVGNKVLKLHGRGIQVYETASVIKEALHGRVDWVDASRVAIWAAKGGVGKLSTNRPKVTPNDTGFFYKDSGSKSLSNKQKGEIGEAASAKNLSRAGYEIRPTKIRGNHGFDTVAVKYNADGSVKDIIINEAKWNKFKLGTTKNGEVKQMSPEWILAKIGRMHISPDREVQKTGRILAENFSKIRLKGSVTSADGITRWRGLGKPFS